MEAMSAELVSRSHSATPRLSSEGYCGGCGPDRQLDVSASKCSWSLPTCLSEIESQTGHGGDSGCIATESFTLPFYLRNIPLWVKECFRNRVLGWNDKTFRQMVKAHCKLPSYLGIVLFRKIQKVQHIAQKLVKEGRLPVEAVTYLDGFHNKIGLRDFLRVWTPAVQHGSRIDRFLALVDIPTRDNVAALEFESVKGPPLLHSQKHVDLRGVKQCIDALINRHPDLAILTNSSDLKTNYAAFVFANICAAFYKSETKTISHRKFRRSNVAQMFYRCASNSVDTVLPFSVSHFMRISALYSHLSNACRSTIEYYGPVEEVSRELLPKLLDLEVSNLVQNRMFSSSHRNSRLDKVTWNFGEFTKFAAAKEDKMRSWSIMYWFPALDLDDDGYLGIDDLHELYRDKYASMTDSGRQRNMPSFCCFLQLLSDSIFPHKEDILSIRGISPLDLKKSGMGSIIFEMLINVQDDSF